jgi:hypothetical protein
MAQTYALLLGAIEIDDSNDTIILDEAGVDLTATIAHGTYFTLFPSAGSIFLAIEAALDAAGANSYEFQPAGISINPSAQSVAWVLGRASGALNFRVRWTHVSTTFDGALLGFVAEKGAASATTETATKSPAAMWVPSDMHTIATPRARWTIAEEQIADGDVEVARFSSRARRLELEYRKLDGARIFQHANQSDPNATLEAFIARHNDGRPIFIHESILDSGLLLEATLQDSQEILGESTQRWKFGQDSGGAFEPEHTRMGLDLWDITLTFLGVVD